MSRGTASFIVAFYFALCIFAASVKAQTKPSWKLGRWSPGYHNSINAIYFAFCGRYVYCPLGNEAYAVAKCETGGTFDIWAGVGRHPYWGLFQMGPRERQLWGYGNDPWKQALGARRYYDYAQRVLGYGWHPWECRP